MLCRLPFQPTSGSWKEAASFDTEARLCNLPSCCTLEGERVHKLGSGCYPCDLYARVPTSILGGCNQRLELRVQACPQLLIVGALVGIKSSGHPLTYRAAMPGKA